MDNDIQGNADIVGRTQRPQKMKLNTEAEKVVPAKRAKKKFDDDAASVVSLYLQQNKQRLKPTGLETIYESPVKRRCTGRRSLNPTMTLEENMGGKKLPRAFLFTMDLRPSKAKERSRREKARRVCKMRGTKLLDLQARTITDDDIKAALADLLDSSDEENNGAVANARGSGSAKICHHGSSPAEERFHNGSIIIGDTSLDFDSLVTPLTGLQVDEAVANLDFDLIFGNVDASGNVMNSGGHQKTSKRRQSGRVQRHLLMPSFLEAEVQDESRLMLCEDVGLKKQKVGLDPIDLECLQADSSSCDYNDAGTSNVPQGNTQCSLDDSNDSFTQCHVVDTETNVIIPTRDELGPANDAVLVATDPNVNGSVSVTGLFSFSDSLSTDKMSSDLSNMKDEKSVNNTSKPIILYTNSKFADDLTVSKLPGKPKMKQIGGTYFGSRRLSGITKSHYSPFDCSLSPLNESSESAGSSSVPEFESPLSPSQLMSTLTIGGNELSGKGGNELTSEGNTFEVIEGVKLQRLDASNELLGIQKQLFEPRNTDDTVKQKLAASRRKSARLSLAPMSCVEMLGTLWLNSPSPKFLDSSTPEVVGKKGKGRLSLIGVKKTKQWSLDESLSNETNMQSVLNETTPYCTNAQNTDAQSVLPVDIIPGQLNPDTPIISTVPKPKARSKFSKSEC